MTAKERRKMCRIKVNRLTKMITYISLVVFFITAEYFQLNGYYTALVGTTIWFYMPDFVVHLLEKKYKINHDLISYR